MYGSRVPVARHVCHCSWVKWGPGPVGSSSPSLWSETPLVSACALSPLRPLLGDFSAPAARALPSWTLVPQPHLDNCIPAREMNFLLPPTLPLSAPALQGLPLPSGSIWVTSFSFSLLGFLSNPQPHLTWASMPLERVIPGPSPGWALPFLSSPVQPGAFCTQPFPAWM